MISLNDNEKIHDISVISVKDRLISMDAIILFQKEEITKTESLILELKKCIIKQNEALLMFKNEKTRLEIAKSIKFKSISEGISDEVECHNQENNCGKISDVEPMVINLCDEPMETNDDLKRKHPSKVDNGTDPKCRKVTPTVPKINGTMNGCEQIAIPPTNQQHITKTFFIPEIGKEKVLKIVRFKEDVCFGGSGGLLLKYRHPNVDIIGNLFRDNIEQMEIVKRNLKFYLIIFTKPRILIYDDSDLLLREIDLPGIGSVFNDISLIYIPTSNGHIDKLSISDFVVKNHINHNQGEVRCFVPGSGKNMQALISLQDSALYKADKRDLHGLSIVEGTANIRRIMRVRFCNFLCYSDEKIWFFNSDFDIVKVLTIEYGIKIVDVADVSGVVVDGRNTVHLYRVENSGKFGKKIYSQSVGGVIDAVTVMKNYIMAAVGPQIFILDNTL